MGAEQLEFPLDECVSLEERVAWLKHSQDSNKEENRRSTKKLFLELSSLKKENAEIKRILRDLVTFLDKSPQ